LTSDGLPVGLQLVGKPSGEAALLAAASAFEEIFGVSRLVPVDTVHPPGARAS
jgi:amidase